MNTKSAFDEAIRDIVRQEVHGSEPDERVVRKIVRDEIAAALLPEVNRTKVVEIVREVLAEVMRPELRKIMSDSLMAAAGSLNGVHAAPKPTPAPKMTTKVVATPNAVVRVPVPAKSWPKHKNKGQGDKTRAFFAAIKGKLKVGTPIEMNVHDIAKSTGTKVQAALVALCRGSGTAKLRNRANGTHLMPEGLKIERVTKPPVPGRVGTRGRPLTLWRLTRTA